MKKTVQINSCGILTILKKPKMKLKREILRLVNQGLEAQFDIYSWAQMIDDIDVLTGVEKEWAKNHTGYRAYIC